MPGKRVDVITKYFHPVTAGIETNIAETYSVLAKNGWKVVVHATADSYLQKNVYPPMESFRGMDIVRYPSKMFAYFPDIDWSSDGVIALHNFNVLPHGAIMAKALFLKLLGKKKFKLVVTPHGGYNPEWTVFPWAIALVKRAYHYTLGAFLVNRSADLVRAVSEWERQEMISHGLRPGLVKVISNGVEIAALDAQEGSVSQPTVDLVKKLGKYVIQVGRVYPIKNYETTLMALAMVDPSINYAIVGPEADCEYRQKLDAMIIELGLQGRVHFLGVKHGADKFYLMRHSIAMVHMAIWESFCNVIHEAMSQGVPCIVADNTALPYLVKEGVNGWCIETHDHRALASRIDYLVANINSAEMDAIRSNNVEFAKSHSWPNVARKMEESYLQA